MYALFELSKIIGCKKKWDDSVAGGSQQKPDVRDLKHWLLFTDLGPNFSQITAFKPTVVASVGHLGNSEELEEEWRSFSLPSGGLHVF